MRLAGGGLQFLAGGFAFLNVEVPVAAQAVGIAAMAHGASDMEIGSRQCFTGERGDDSLFQKTVSAAAQTAGADPQTAHRIGTATDIAAGFINPAGPITGAPGLVAQTANGARLGQEVTAASSLPSYVAGTSAVLHAAAAPAQMVGTGEGGEETENDKSEDEKTKTGQEVSEAEGETPKKPPDMTPIPGATEQEQAIDSYLRGLGHDVKPNPLEGQPGAGRQPDRIIDGTFTEYKSVSGIKKLDSDGLSGGLSRRIVDGRGQAPDIIVDTRDQPGMTRDIAERGVKRAYIADWTRPGKSGNRIQSIRVIGNGFDFTAPNFTIPWRK